MEVLQLSLYHQVCLLRSSRTAVVAVVVVFRRGRRSAYKTVCFDTRRYRTGVSHAPGTIFSCPFSWMKRSLKQRHAYLGDTLVFSKSRTRALSIQTGPTMSFFSTHVKIREEHICFVCLFFVFSGKREQGVYSLTLLDSTPVVETRCLELESQFGVCVRGSAVLKGLWPLLSCTRARLGET